MSTKLSDLIKDLEHSISEHNSHNPNDRQKDPRIIVGTNILKGILMIWGDLEVVTNTLEWIIKYEEWKYDTNIAHNKVVYGTTNTYGESCTGIYTGLHWKNIGNIVVVNDSFLETEFDLTTDGVDKKLKRHNVNITDILSVERDSDSEQRMIVIKGV